MYAASLDPLAQHTDPAQANTVVTERSHPPHVTAGANLYGYQASSRACQSADLTYQITADGMSMLLDS